MSETVRVSEKKSEAVKEDRTSQTRTSDYSQPINSSIDRILFLQRTIGNQAVGKLIKSGALQTKLKIGQPDDIYEQEADRVAEQVMRIPAPVQRKCPKCEDELKRQPEKEEEEEETLQAKEVSGSTPEVLPEQESHVSALRGGGQPLPEHVRAFYEPRFGHDFSQVRMHADAKAAESARAVNARAFTVGQNIVFGMGQYAPLTNEGNKLIAHELTHVVQQTSEPIGGTSPLVQHRLVWHGRLQAQDNPATERPGKIPEIDQMRASLQVSFRVRIPQYSNVDLVAEAQRLNNKLFQPEEDVGPREKSVIAETLIQMHQEMDRRIQEAAVSQIRYPPVLKDIQWRENDPLAGIVESISPFHMIDWWGYLTQPKTPVLRQTKAKRQKMPPLAAPQPHRPVPGPSPSVREPGHESALPPAPHPPQIPHIRPPHSPDPPLGIIWDLLKNWILAKSRGIEEAAHDIAIEVYAAGIESMAVKVSDEAFYTIPEPDYDLIKPILEGRIKTALDRETARRAQARGIAIGLKAAKDSINKLEEKIATKEVRAIPTPDGRLVRCSGLECARPDSVIIVPAQRRGIDYLRYLKRKYRSGPSIYGHILRELARRGVVPRIVRIRGK